MGRVLFCEHSADTVLLVLNAGQHHIPSKCEMRCRLDHVCFSAMAPHLGIGIFHNLDECVESVSLCVGAVLADTGPLNLQEPVFLTQPLVNPASLLLAKL